MNIIVANNPNYSAIIRLNQMECLYKDKSVTVLAINSQNDVTKILAIWSQLNISPQLAQRVHEAIKDLIGIDLSQITLSQDGGSILYRLKVIRVF